jgi:SsrA-binding protein
MSLIQNKKVGFDYEILEKYSAGLELLGLEVKSLRSKKGSLRGAHITVRGGEALLLNAHIPPYQENNTPESYDPYRNRRLLLTKKEIAELGKQEEMKGLTIVPLSVYNKGRGVKIDIAIVRGQKKIDKREKIKERQSKRDVERSLKERIR